MVKTTTKLNFLKNGTMVYEVRMSCGPAPRGYRDDDHDAWEAQYEIEKFVPDYYDDAGHILAVAEGKEYMILSTFNTITANSVYRLTIADDNGEGWAGNSNPTHKRYRGWRGTSCNYSARGEGIRKLISIERTGNRSKKLRLVFGPDTSN